MQALDALLVGDEELYRACKAAVESDFLTYRFIAWHIAVYANLLTLAPDVERFLSASEDPCTQWTGQKDAKALLKQMATAAAGVPKDSETSLALIRMDIPLVVAKGTTREITLTVTSAAIPRVQGMFSRRVDALISLQINLDAGVVEINRFLESATAESVRAIPEALEQLVSLRSGKKGAPSRPSRRWWPWSPP